MVSSNHQKWDAAIHFNSQMSKGNVKCFPCQNSQFFISPDIEGLILIKDQAVMQDSVTITIWKLKETVKLERLPSREIHVLLSQNPAVQGYTV